MGTIWGGPEAVIRASVFFIKCAAPSQQSTKWILIDRQINQMRNIISFHFLLSCFAQDRLTIAIFKFLRWFARGEILISGSCTIIFVGFNRKMTNKLVLLTSCMVILFVVPCNLHGSSSFSFVVPCNLHGSSSFSYQQPFVILWSF